jgi:hypothetical protein
MVNNDTQILDDGELKEYVIKGIKAMSNQFNPKDKYYYYKLYRACMEKKRRRITKKVFDEQKLEETEIEIDNPDYKSFDDFPRLKYATKVWRERQKEAEENYKIFDYWQEEKEWVERATIEEVEKYLGIKKFKKHVMLNLSPHWPDDCKSCLLDGDDRLQYIYILRGLLKKLMDKLLNLKWFTDYEYVIETGKRGNHPHVHAVAEVNEMLYKQFNTWIKSNWTKSVNDIWKQVIRGSVTEEAVGSVMKGARCCQRNIINCPIMLQDKKDYLREELKPEDHKNLNKEESLFTSKNI